MADGKFQALFCERVGCDPSDYEKRAFRELLYPHARFFALLLLKVTPKYFADDLKLIRYLGEAEDFQEAAACVADFRDSNNSRRGFLRARCKLRVSGRKAGKLVRQIFI